ncbi:hypothetical protein LWI29_008847 [Acer saccharum]|uniref:RNase H type-1 domain-containing protein n=1 Tax=Acer saccharum TaxID=4024 RepID=A0AA39VF75_ACESA|nr:hypothetical protein LWI29_008847 [Acer saccharum]
MRNTFVHEAKKVDKDEIIGWSEKYLDVYQSLNTGNMRGNSCRDRESIDRRVGWSPPDKDEYKTNCGIAVDSNSGKVGLGIIVRNSNGEVMACCSQKLNSYISKRDANALAISRDIQFGIDCGLNSRMIESNDGVIVNWINMGLNRDSNVGIILSDIDGLGADMGGLNCILVNNSDFETF